MLGAAKAKKPRPATRNSTPDLDRAGSLSRLGLFRPVSNPERGRRGPVLAAAITPAFGNTDRQFWIPMTELDFCAPQAPLPLPFLAMITSFVIAYQGTWKVFSHRLGLHLNRALDPTNSPGRCRIWYDPPPTCPPAEAEAQAIAEPVCRECARRFCPGWNLGGLQGRPLAPARGRGL